MERVQELVNTNVSKVLKNPFVMAILKIVLVLYASQAAPKLPLMVQPLFANTYFKIFFIVLIAYFADVDLQLGIMLAIIFVLGINFVSGRGLLESYTNAEDHGPYFSDNTKYTNLLGEPAVVGHATLLDAQTDDYPGCTNVTMADLLKVFDNDHLKLQNTVMYSYRTLLEQLPKDSDAMTKLVSISKACGLPYNVVLNDDNAGYLATILLNANFVITDSCRPPQ